MTIFSCATELLNAWKPHVQAVNRHILATPEPTNVCSSSYHGGPDGEAGRRGQPVAISHHTQVPEPVSTPQSEASRSTSCRPHPEVLEWSTLRSTGRLPVEAGSATSIRRHCARRSMTTSIQPSPS